MVKYHAKFLDFVMVKSCLMAFCSWWLKHMKKRHVWCWKIIFLHMFDHYWCSNSRKKNNAWVIMGYISYIILNPHMLRLKYKWSLNQLMNSFSKCSIRIIWGWKKTYYFHLGENNHPSSSYFRVPRVAGFLNIVHPHIAGRKVSYHSPTKRIGDQVRQGIIVLRL